MKGVIDMPAVALVDCNNFYASCERVFNPALVGKPVAVLSNNDGCVVARSQEVKDLGVRLGTPIFQIADLVHHENIQVFSSNYSLYGDLSRRVMDTLARFSPVMEVYSIDEAFLDLSHLGTGELEACGREMRAVVKRWTGIPVSIGIAETKTLAKIANRFAKKSRRSAGVVNLAGSPHLDRALELVPVGKVWGVGRRYARFLERNDVRTAKDLRDAGDGWIKKHMGVVGLRMVRELRGIPCLQFETDTPPKKEVCVSRSFGEPVTTLAAMRESVATYTTRAAEKLRRQGSAAGGVMVFMLTNRFKDEPQYVNSILRRLPVPSDATDELIECALAGVAQIFRQGFRFKKAGVVLTGLVPAGQVQTDLFHYRDFETSARIMEALDGINARMGPGSLTFAAIGIHQRWKTKFNYRSPRYTTRWDELPVVRVGSVSTKTSNVPSGCAV